MSAARFKVGDVVIREYYERGGKLSTKRETVSLAGRKWVSCVGVHGRYDAVSGTCDPALSIGRIFAESDYPRVKARRDDLEQLYSIRTSWGGFDWLTDSDAATIASILRAARARVEGHR